MRTLGRLFLLSLLCLVLLLGTESFSLAAQTDAAEPRVVFAFAQTAPGVCEVSLFGRGGQMDLAPLLALRNACVSALRAVPTEIGAAVETFLTSVFD